MKTDATVIRAVIALVLTTVFWGLSFPLVRMSNLLIERHFAQLESTKFDNEFASAAASTALRFGLALIVLAICFPGQFRRMKPAHWIMGALVGVVFSAGLLLQVVGLNDIPASRSGFLTSLAVVFTPLLMIAVDRRRPALRVFLAVGCALFGVAILTGVCAFGGPFGLTLTENAMHKIVRGDWLTGLAAVIFAVQIILVDVFSRRMPPVLLTAGLFAATFVIGVACFTVHAAVRSPAVPLTHWVELLEVYGFVPLLAAIGIICTVIPFFLMNKYQALVTPTQAALIYTLEPVFATAGAIILPSILSPRLGLDYAAEEATHALIAGGALVLAANLLGFLAAHPPHEASTPHPSTKPPSTTNVSPVT